MDAKYDKLDINQVISEQKHLDEYQKQGLRDLFLKYQKVFDGTLGLYSHRQVHIEVEPGARSVHEIGGPTQKMSFFQSKRQIMKLLV